jgi:uncharacterized protein with HEPN domain
MSSKDKANLLAILDAIDRVNEYTKGLGSPEDFFKSSVVFDASLMNFINIGEMADRLSKELKDRHVDIDWQKVKDFRNLVAHDYLGVDAEEVWQIIKNDLPILRNTVNNLLSDLK